MEALIELAKRERPPEHDLTDLRATDIDACITLSGGDATNAIFESAWGSDMLSELFGLYKTGLLYLDTQSETPLEVVMTSKDEETARKLKPEIERLAKKANSILGRLSERFYEYGPTKGSKGYETFQKEAGRKRRLVKQLSKILTTLEMEVDGAVLRISSKQKSAQQLPEILYKVLPGII